MYLAKDRGKGAYAIFEPAMHAAAVARLQLRADLPGAIAADEITLHYQPIVDLRTGVITAYESLARWQHPERGPGVAGGLHPARRGDRPHRAARPQPPPRGVPAGRRVPRGVHRGGPAAGVA